MAKQKVETVKPKTKTKFTDFDLDDRLIQAIHALGWEHPTQVQEAMIPLAFDGKNIAARARTGSGKTAAFLLPIIQNLLRQSTSEANEEPFALIIAPTKELATQIFKILGLMTSRFPFIQSVNLAENQEANEEIALSTHVDIVVSTPGRVASILNRKGTLFKSLKVVVLDEADLLFSYGYKDELKGIRKQLPKKFQVMMTSATLDEDLTELKTMFATGTIMSLKLKEGDLPNPGQLTQYQVFLNNDEERFTLILSLIKLKLLVGKTIFFVSSIDRCYKLHLFLQGFKVKSCILNSQMPANSRSHVITQFNEGEYKYIIASDARDVIADDSQQNNEKEPEEPEQPEETEKEKSKKKGKKQRIKHDRESGVSRGIDFHFVSNVVNFDFPETTEVYIHRVGRTARGFNKGTAISLVAPNEEPKFEAVQQDINAQLGEDAIMPYEVRMSDFDSFLIRSREVLSAVTKTVIREARLAEIKRELLKSKRLEAYFKANPREKMALQMDKQLFHLKLHSTAIGDVADYMVPKALRGRDYSARKDNGTLGSRKRHHDGGGRQRGSKRGKKSQKKNNNPLYSFKL